MPDILVFLYTYDRDDILQKSLHTMTRNPGMPFRLWVLDNGSYFSNLYGDNSGAKQLNTLLDYYKSGLIEKLIISNSNSGIHFAINQIMALMKLQSQNPEINHPDFVMLTNDDMIYEDNWLTETYNTFIALEEKERVAVVSPFHCKHLSGDIAHGMQTIKTVEYDGTKYEIKTYVSGNTWFMRGKFFLETLDWYPINHPTEGGDWQKLAILQKNNLRCAITPTEMAHHDPDAQQGGKYNRLGHW